MVVKPFALYSLSGLLVVTAFAIFGAEDKDSKPSLPAPEPRVNIEPRIRPSKEPQDPAATRETSIRVETQLVLINVTVTDPMNRFVTGLEKEHFKLSEEKVDQTITQFSSEDAPLSVGLVFDASGSMNNKLSKSREAAAQFFKTANPEDEFFLVQFNNRPELAVGFTSNTEEIQNRLTFTQAKGSGVRDRHLRIDGRACTVCRRDGRAGLVE
jgi:Ca-activated chloride channel family protein